MNRFFSLLIIIYLTFFITFAKGTDNYFNKLDSWSKLKLNKVLQADSKEEISRALSAVPLDVPFNIVNGKVCVKMFVKLSYESDLEKVRQIADVNTSIGDICTINIPADKLKELLNQDWLLRAEVSKKVYPLLDKSRPEINADKVQDGVDLPMPYRGDGVIVGVFDSGIDFTHPDFSGENGTRILYLWDMTDRGIIKKPPFDYDFGYEYSKFDIDNTPGLVLQRDPDINGGHGTHVTGTAAGSGKADVNFTGIAPNASIIFVKGTRSDDIATFDETDIIAGCDYIFKKADELGMPAIINLSLGTPLGPHDGSSLQDKALSKLVGKGKIIAASAGNEGGYPMHSGAQVKANEPFTSIIIPYINLCDFIPGFCPDIPNFFRTAADMWYDIDAVDAVSIGVYDSQTFQQLANMDITNGIVLTSEPLAKGDTVYGYITEAFSENNENNNGNLPIMIDNNGDTNAKVQNYYWAITTIGSKNGRVDMWAAVPLTGDNAMTIGSPGSAKNIISVGSYISKNAWTDIDGNEQSNGAAIGKISDFSSRGPTRDGRMVPIISAPGQHIFAPLSSHLTNPPRNMMLQGGKYQGMQGTSMATPHVVGVIALMLQADKNLTPEDIKNNFSTTARRDNFTGNEPNNTYGNGKLDALASVKSVFTSVPYDENKYEQISVYPNPANDIILVTLNNPEQAGSLNLYNSLGKIISQQKLFLNNAEINKSVIDIDVSNLPSGAYFIRFANNNNIAPFLISR